MIADARNILYHRQSQALTAERHVREARAILAKSRTMISIFSALKQVIWSSYLVLLSDMRMRPVDRSLITRISDPAIVRTDVLLGSEAVGLAAS